MCKLYFLAIRKCYKFVNLCLQWVGQRPESSDESHSSLAMQFEKPTNEKIPVK